MKEKETYNKIFQMSSENCIFSGNRIPKEKIGNGMQHIEDFFPLFLENNPFYNDIYYELLKIDNHFRYLKELLVQIQWIVMKGIVTRIQNNKSNDEIIKQIENDFADNVTQLELLFSYLIISDYLGIIVQDTTKFSKKRIVKITAIRRELYIIFKREVIKFPVTVEFSSDPVTTFTNDPGANGKWWVYPKNENLLKIENGYRNAPIKKLVWTGRKNQLYDVIRQLKKKELISNSYLEIADFICQSFEGFENNYSTVLKEIQRDQRPAKNKRINLDLSVLTEIPKSSSE